MKKNKETSDNGKLVGVDSALLRAGQRAREIAEKTGTPLVTYSDGKIKKIMIRPKPATRSS